MLFGRPLVQAATLRALLLAARPDPTLCSRFPASGLLQSGLLQSGIAADELASVAAAAAASAPPPDEGRKQEMPLEDAEGRAALLKCFLEQGQAKAKQGWPRSDSLLEQEAAASRGASASAAALVGDRAEAQFYNYMCTAAEFEDFKKKFGLSGEGGFPEANFGVGGICKERNVVWLYPQHDRNSAFDITRNVCHRLLRWSDVACSVHVRRVGTVLEAESFLERFPANSILHIVLGGHGHGMALRWGSTADGWFGVLQRRRPVSPGNMVTARKPVKSISRNATTIQQGDRGYVINVDSDRDAYVYFDEAGYQWVARHHFMDYYSDFEVGQSWVADFLQALKSRMQWHGSVFLDSCKSATSQYSPNLAQSVAQLAGKGVRVIGAEVSFSKVDATRFNGGWHAALNVDDMQDAQRVFVNAEARCPSISGQRRPDEEGNCRCRRGQRCSTRSGKACPAARNFESDTRFLPFCGESWAQDPCLCSWPSSARSRAAKSSGRAECPNMARRREPDEDGNCRCRGGQRCSTRSGGPCPTTNGTSEIHFLPSCGEGSAQDPCICSWSSSSSSGGGGGGQAAECPGAAGRGEPDENGNCRCRWGQRCRTRSGMACPAANNEKSGAHFLPSCGASSAEDPCLCSWPSSAGGQGACPSMAAQSEPDGDGNCECRGGGKCRTRGGRVCPLEKNLASDSHFLPFCAESSAEDPCLCSAPDSSSRRLPSAASRLRPPRILLLLSVLR